jgi:hypothetical protein
MSRAEKESVLSRWSRLKRESTRTSGETEAQPDQEVMTAENESRRGGETPRPARVDEPLPELPSLDELGPDSDFRGFMNPDVDDGLRRAALKKLFSDPHFNVTDGLDVYAEDYTNLESMTPAMVAGLKHAQRLLFGDAQDDKPADATSAATSPERPANEEQARLQAEAQTAHAQQEEGEKQEEIIDDTRAGGPDDATEIAPPATSEISKA